MPRPTYGPEVKRRTAALFALLLDYANDQLVVDDKALDLLRPQIQVHWQSEQRLVVRTNVRSLQALSKLGHNMPLSSAQIKESLRRLADFLEILEDNRPNASGSETWHFTLKLWCHRHDRAALDQHLEQAWEARRSQTSSSPPKLALKPTQADPWIERCESGLTTKLTTNPLTVRERISFDWQSLYVPLEIMPRPAMPQISDTDSLDLDFTDDAPQSPDQFLEKMLSSSARNRIAIVGEPGTGKTTLLQKLGWGLIQAQQLPIWVSLADLQDATLERFLLEDWLKIVSRQIVIAPELQQDLATQVQQGRVWLLLDAIDEMALEPSAALSTIARQLRGWLKDAHIILTCRSHVWDSGKNSLADFDSYANLAFTEQTQTFIQHWFSRQPELSQSLCSELAKPERHQIRDIVKNPLRLALLCRTWSLHQGFPTTKTMLYHQFVEALYDWKQDRMPTDLGQRQQLNRALGTLAIAALLDRQTKFRLSSSFILRVWGEAAADCLPLAISLGWLTQVGILSGTGEKIYAFYHPTFQEYFAAQAIENWHLLGVDWLTKLLEPQWWEVVLFWLGRPDLKAVQKAELLQVLQQLEDPTGFYRPRAYFLIAAGLAEFSESSIATQVVNQLMLWRFGHYNPEHNLWQWYPQRLQAGCQIALMRTDRELATTAYETYLQNQLSFFARWHAAYSLGNVIAPQHPLALSVLRELIESADNLFLKVRLCEALERVNSQDEFAITMLRQILAETQEDSIRRKSAHCLVRILQDSTAIATLEHLAKTAEPQIKRQAAASLAQLIPGHPLALIKQPRVKKRQPKSPRGERSPASIAQEMEFLIAKLSHPPNLNARIRYAYRLGKMAPNHPQVLQTFLAVLQEPGQDAALYRWVADCLNEVLTVKGMPEVIAALHPLMPSPSSPYTPQTAVAHGILWEMAKQISYTEFKKILDEGHSGAEK